MYYDMSQRRIAIIFNHFEYDDSFHGGVTKRLGANKDEAKLEEVLKSKGFDVKICPNYTHRNILDEMQRISREKNVSCLIVVMMTHGTPGSLYAYDKLYDVSDLWKDLDRHLIGVPKLFFIQACRGKMVDEGAVTCDGDNDVATPPNDISLWENFLHMYSTYEGYYSWREAGGSWFITSLCKALKEDETNELDLLQLLTIVNYDVARNYKTKTNEKKTNKKKQMPQIVSTLTKFVNFKIQK